MHKRKKCFHHNRTLPKLNDIQDRDRICGETCVSHHFFLELSPNLAIRPRVAIIESDSIPKTKKTDDKPKMKIFTAGAQTSITNPFSTKKPVATQMI